MTQRVSLFRWAAARQSCAPRPWARLIEEGHVKRVLIVAPKRVGLLVWPAELKKWDHLQHLTLAVAIGTEAERLAAIESPAQIVVINFENLVWFFKRKHNFDCLVIDELSKMKNAQTKRHKCLRKHLGEFQRPLWPDRHTDIKRRARLVRSDLLHRPRRAPGPDLV